MKMTSLLFGVGALAACCLTLLPFPFGALSSALAGLALASLWWLLRPAGLAGMKPARRLMNTIGVSVPRGLLITSHRGVTAAACPMQIEPTLRLRADSGALLLATAFALELPAKEQNEDAAALRRCLASLKLLPETMLRQCPCLGETTVAEVSGHVYRDGKGCRAYALDETDDLLTRCTHLWEGRPRPITEEDRSALRRVRAALSGENVTVLCAAMAERRALTEDASSEEAVFLGMLCVDAEEQPEAREAIARLRKAGLTVAVADGEIGAAHLTQRFALDAWQPELLPLALSDAEDAATEAAAKEDASMPIKGEALTVSADKGWEEAPLRLLQTLWRGQRAWTACVGQVIGLTLAAWLGGFGGLPLTLCWGLLTVQQLLHANQPTARPFHKRRECLSAVGCAVLLAAGAMLCRGVGGMQSAIAGSACAAVFAGCALPLMGWMKHRDAAGLCVCAAGIVLSAAASTVSALTFAFAVMLALLCATVQGEIHRVCSRISSNCS